MLRLQSNDGNTRESEPMKIRASQVILTILLFGLIPLSNATICGNNIVSGTCQGSVSVTTGISLTGDLNVSGNFVITNIGSLQLNGHSLLIGGAFINQGSISGGLAGNGGAASGSLPNSEAGGSGAYGGYIQAYKITAGTVSLTGENGYPSHGLSNGGNGGYNGGSTLINGGSAGGASGSSVSPPSLSNLIIQNMYSSGMVNYVTGAGGGTGGGQSGSNGGSYASSYAGSGGGGGSSGCAPGTGNCNGGNGGGGGGGSIIWAYGAGGMTSGSYSLTGGSGGGGAGNSGGSGGSGTSTAYSYGSTPPLSVIKPIAPTVNSITPTNTLEVVSTTYNMILTSAAYPYAIKNTTIYWGDGSSTLVTSSSNTVSQAHAYAYLSSPSPTSFSMNVVVCDTDASCSSNLYTITATRPNLPYADSITPLTVLEANSVTYTVNAIQGDFTIKNTTVNWGDGTSNALTSSSTSPTFTHTYAYVAGAKPNLFNANIVVCDVQTLCYTSYATITGIYTIPIVDTITSNTATMIATMPYAFTFNIIQGNYIVTNLQVTWGDGASNAISVNTLNPSITHNYTIAGNYPINVVAIDQNNAYSIALSNTVTINPYIKPSISMFNPSSVASTTNTLYYFTVTQGTFALATTNNLAINWGWGNSITTNILTGANSIHFEYNVFRGNFSAVATITDINGRTGTNITLISVSPYPWNFTTASPSINYNVTNSSSTQAFIQTNETDVLPLTYTIQKNNIVNDYSCSESMSNAYNSLFTIKCTTNPFALSYVNQTLSITVTAKDTYGVSKNLQLQIKLYTKQQAPVIPNAPFSYNTPVAPLATTPFTPLDKYLLIIVVAAVLIFTATLGFTMHGKKNAY